MDYESEKHESERTEWVDVLRRIKETYMSLSPSNNIQ